MILIFKHLAHGSTRLCGLILYFTVYTKKEMN